MHIVIATVMVENFREALGTMHFLRTGIRFDDDAINRVATHAYTRHPMAAPIFWNEKLDGIKSDCQLWVVGHGSNNGFFCETTAYDSPRFSGESFASLLQAKALPTGVKIRIKLAQCWGGIYIGDESPIAQAHNQEWSFARKLALTLNTPPFHYPQVQVGGFESEAHWMFKGKSKTSGIKSYTAPSLRGDTHLSRVWYDSAGTAMLQGDARDANEAAFVYFPFDFQTKAFYQ